jgi:hypothetical protein
MKKITTLFLFPLMALAAISQNLKRITGLKDAWGVEINYTGEVKNGKPDGYGVAMYLTGNPLRYAGSFVNGVYEGKGTLFFKDGAILTGTWKKGKLNGKGMNIHSDKSIYVGDFINGEKNGKGVFVNNEYSIYLATYQNDNFHGRILGVWNSGNIITDLEYRDGKRNGMGYQYEAKTKKLHEGEWKDDKWVKTGTPVFSSFLKSSLLVSQMTDDRVVIGKTNSNNKLIDSSYYFDLKQKKKYLGYYENGSLRSGVIVRNDSSVFIGSLNEKGASGYSYFYKTGKSYSEGNYVNDYLNGEVVDIDLAKKTVYYGTAVDGFFTGKARFFNEAGTQFTGDYKSGKFTGTGSKIETNGRYTSGTWEDGKVMKLTTAITPDGDVISGTPKTFAEGLNAVVKSYPNLFFEIFGVMVEDKAGIAALEEMSEEYFPDFNYSLISIPGSVGKNTVIDDWGDNAFYYAQFLKTADGNKAKAKYNELHNLVQATSITSNLLAAKQKFTGTLKAANLSNFLTETEYSLTGNDDKFKKCKIWLRLRQSGNSYIVELLIGEKAEDY